MSDMYIFIGEQAAVPDRVDIGKANVGVIGFDGANDSLFMSMSATLMNAGDYHGFIISQKSDFDALYRSAPSDTPLKKWIDSYFTELVSQADTARLYVYRVPSSYGGGSYADQVALRAGDLTLWKTVYSPVVSITTVKVSYAKDNYTGLPGVVTQSSGNYTVEVDANGNYTGVIQFDANCPVNSNGDPQAIDPNVDTVLLTYTTSGLSEILKAFNNQDVQFMNLAYDHGKMTGSSSGQGIYNGVSWLDDQKCALTHCVSRSSAGWARSLIASDPANKLPSDLMTNYGGSGSSHTFGQLKSSVLGYNKRVINPAWAQTIATSGTYLGSFDGGAVMAALIREVPVRKTLTGLIPNTAMIPYQNESTLQALKSSSMVTEVLISNLIQQPFVNYGYTFGAGFDKWISKIRCDDQIRHLLMSSLLQLILSGKVNYDMSGMALIKSTISATMTQCQINGWHDGLVSITIPIEQYLKIPVASRTPTDQAIIDAARATGAVTGIVIKYQWGTPVEQIVISALEMI